MTSKATRVFKTAEAAIGSIERLARLEPDISILPAAYALMGRLASVVQHLEGLNENRTAPK